MRLRHSVKLLLAAVICSTSLAAGDDIPPATASAIRATMKERYPEVQVEGIHKSPLPGLYELETGAELIYANEDASMIFAGRIIDTKTRTDLTSERWDTLNAVDFNTLPFDLALKVVRGDGSRKLVVFADPMCPYCRMLEQEMQGINNVTIYTFLYPLEQIHPGSSKKALNIWCAKNPTDAWTKWMVKQTDPGTASCTTAPIDKLQTLGQKLHIDSTPTMFTVEGKRVRGAMKHNDIEQLLTATHK
jgi:thiol:disulfide interchange protein DsbC